MRTGPQGFSGRRDPASALEEAADTIASARHPVLLVGGGAQSASTQVVALAESVQAPVVATLNGLGVVPHDHRLFLSDARSLSELPEQMDLLIAIGTRFSAESVLSGLL